MAVATLAEAKEKLEKGITRETLPTGAEVPVWSPPYIAAAGPLPRIIDANERATSGTSRFKVKGPGECQTYYVLAKKGDKAAAMACYREETGVKEPVELSVRQLDD